MKKNQLSVRLHGEPIGTLEQTSTGKMHFSYEPSATQTISVGMPIQEEAYRENQCEAFFGGLLPESDQARKAIANRYGISFSNSFALLKAIGHDCAGAISFHEMKEPIMPQRQFPLSGKIVSEENLYKHIKLLPEKPLFLDFEGLRLSLAGVQDKAAICLIDNQIALPKQDCPTTHILKPAIDGFEEIIKNEYFCMKVAKRVGIPVPDVEIRQVKDIHFLLIKRYDREIINNTVERIHQEDFCQALGVVSSRKYQNEGGPGFKACFDLLNSTNQPAKNRNLLATVMVFNYLMGNMDAHGKNFSLLHTKQSNVELTPFYDIICTCVYPKLTSKMAMKIGSQYQFDHVFPRHWEQMCKTNHYSYPAMVRLIKKQAHLILTALQQEKDEMNTSRQNGAFIDKITQWIENHVAEILNQFKH